MESTSTQVGFSTYSANAPKVIRKVKEKAYGGLTLIAFGVAVGWVVISIIFLIPLAFTSSWIYECFVGSFLFGWWRLYFKYVHNEEKLEETVLFFQFFFDGYCGLHTITRYDTSLTFLQDVFPLKDIHEEGLIEFFGNSFGLLIKFIPPEVREEDDDVHALKMQEVIDGLAGQTSLKFIAQSRKNLRKPFLEKLLKMMNRAGINKKVYEYLYSIYEMIKNKGEGNVNWTFYAFFALGEFDKLDDARDQMDSEYPGLVDNLTSAGMRNVRKLTDPLEIAREYRHMALPVVIE